MLVDSHCHLNFPELVQNMDQVLDTMRSNEVGHALCVSVTLDKFPEVLAIAEQHPNIYASVGVHPDYEDIQEPTVEELVRLANHPRVVAIGETGLDYFRLTGDLEWQRHRFRIHIRAAKATGKPLIIHTRNAAEDTLRLMEEEGAAEIGGVMHCFTESWEVAQAAIEMGFYISFSGIVTFKNAQALKDVAQKVPLDKILVETDSPYLAPIPFRGKTNQPAYVRHVAEEVARLRDVPLQQFMDTTTANFFKLFKHAQPCKSLS
ncbi:TatD family hydrolase [Methylophilus methylotrophus]|uniref:TatD family hydrolase n=1 Tax=Methylophilus methylotrophus TaxID=17 RepID=UPI0003726B93|nr:TatD family hydrolase [Methylophilus methylotrophus]